jgi:putative transposase
MDPFFLLPFWQIEVRHLPQPLDAPTLEICAAIYRELCKRYKPKPKPEKKRAWGKKLLAGISLKPKKNKTSPGQQRLPWDDWQAPSAEIYAVAKTFVLANALNPEIASMQFDNST